MKYLVYVPFLWIMIACNTLPQLYQAAEDIADDNAVEVKISREAIQKQTDVDVVVNVKNNPSK
jgi:hypothetical protein